MKKDDARMRHCAARRALRRVRERLILRPPPHSNFLNFTSLEYFYGPSDEYEGPTAMDMTAASSSFAAASPADSPAAGVVAAVEDDDGQAEGRALAFLDYVTPSSEKSSYSAFSYSRQSSTCESQGPAFAPAPRRRRSRDSFSRPGKSCCRSFARRCAPRTDPLPWTCDGRAAAVPATPADQR